MALTDGFAMPVELVKVSETATAKYARFIAEPWEKGFGNTIGNALRRVLLSSLEGVAVCSVKIDGVQHEFATITDVVEDVAEIILNLKRLRVKCTGSLPRVIELRADKKGQVTAGNIVADGVTEVLNPELVICTLDKNVPLRMEIEIKSGRGFSSSEENKAEEQAIGVIPVDSYFSPVERVRYDVQACRVGQRTDYDSLELDIWTDGGLSPEVALQQASLLLREHLNIFTPVGTPKVAPKEVNLTDPEDIAFLDRLCVSVNDMELSVRAKNCLNNAQIRTLGQLVRKPESEMLKFRNFGKKSLQEIKEKLEENGLSLGMPLKDEIAAALEQRLAAASEEKEERDKECAIASIHSRLAGLPLTWRPS